MRSYIKNIDGAVQEMGGEVIEKITIKNGDNALNPTVCFVIKPPSIHNESPSRQVEIFSVPGTNISLQKEDEFYYSSETGLCYPILKNIPIPLNHFSYLQ